MDSDAVRTSKRKTLHKAFISSLFAKMNSMLILRSRNSRGDGPTEGNIPFQLRQIHKSS